MATPVESPSPPKLVSETVAGRAGVASRAGGRQNELVVWLQSFASPALTSCLSWVSLFGYTPIYLALVLGLAFGHRLGPTVKILIGVLLAIILTQGLKTGLTLPPSDVEERVQTHSYDLLDSAGTAAVATGLQPLWLPFDFDIFLGAPWVRTGAFYFLSNLEANLGIQRGWYSAKLASADCQRVDVTGVDPIGSA